MVAGGHPVRVAPDTVNARMRVLKLIFEQAQDDDLIVKNPAKKLTKVDDIAPERVTVPIETFLKVVERVRKTHPWAVTAMWLALGTGARISETAGLQRSNLDLDAGTVRLQHVVEADATVRAWPKGRGPRTVALTARLLKELRAHVDRYPNGPQVFYWPGRGEVVTAKQIRGIWERLVTVWVTVTVTDRRLLENDHWGDRYHLCRYTHNSEDEKDRLRRVIPRHVDGYAAIRNLRGTIRR